MMTTFPDRDSLGPDDPGPLPSIGPYRILKSIGWGGMGRVFLAERADDHYQQQVAIKLLKQNVIDNERVLRLFHEERQILANLQHPNITRLLDGGSLEDGSPFLVMEYIDGEPIDSYCARNALSLDQRLALFTTVCHAVQYAHRNLVVHRDLKPSNIAVNRDGEPKLMDFGVAKLLAPEHNGRNPETEIGQRALTPHYASPEQLLGEPVSTVSDVYALGVILHELLTGKRPHDGPDRGPYAQARRITDSDPLPPSTMLAENFNAARSDEQPSSPVPGMDAPQLLRHLKGDLGSIVMMALARDPAHRYQSAAELAADIDNYRAHRPVRGRPALWHYRATRFIQRNRVACALGLVFFVSVTALGATLYHQAGLLELERDFARDQLARTSAALALVEDVFLGLDPDNSQGETVSVREMLDLAGSRMEARQGSFGDAPPAVEAVLRRIIGETYNHLGLIQPAKRHLGEAVRLHRSVGLSNDEEAFKSLLGLAETHHLAFEQEPRLELALEALALGRRLHGEDSPATVSALSAVASSYHMLGRLEEAKHSFAEIHRRRVQSLGESHALSVAALGNIGVADHWLGNFDEALQSYQRCQAIGTAALGKKHPEVLRCQGMRGLVLESMGRYAEAAPVLAEHVATSSLVMGAAHPATLRSRHSLADAYRGLGQYDLAEQAFLAVLADRREALGQRHIETLQTEMKLARLYRLTGRYTEAEPLIAHALAEETRQFGFEHPTTLVAAQEQADLYLDAGRLSEAAPLLRRVLASRERVLGEEHPELQNTLLGLGRVEMADLRYDEARDQLQRALRLAELNPEFQSSRRADVVNLLTEVSEQLGDTAPTAGSPQ